MQELAVITAAPISFATAVVIVGALIWLIVNWSYNSILASKNAEISLQDRRLADYREKLGGASPSEAEHRIEVLTSRLAKLEPRRLDEDQREKILGVLRRYPGNSYLLRVSRDAACPDCDIYATDIASLIRSVSGWSVNEPMMIAGPAQKSPKGLLFLVEDPHKLTGEGAILVQAFIAAKIDFDISEERMKIPPDSLVKIPATTIEVTARLNH
jgi:hypothetical protein